MLIKPVIQSSLNPVTTLKMSTYGAHYDAAIKIFNDNKFLELDLKILEWKVEIPNIEIKSLYLLMQDKQLIHIKYILKYYQKLVWWVTHFFIIVLFNNS